MRITTDLHTHTVANTHAYSTVTENAVYASKNGIEAIAITDHGPSMPDGAHRWHFLNSVILPRTIEGVKILRGAEVNILSADGKLDLSDEYMESLDWVIVSFHQPSCSELGSFSERTQCYINLLANPQVDMLGHCGAPNFDFDIPAVIDAAKEYDKVIEINENTFNIRSDNVPVCKRIALECAKKGVKISVDSDAHFYTHIGKFDKALAMLDEISFPEELIVNANWERLESHLNSRINGKKFHI